MNPALIANICTELRKRITNDVSVQADNSGTFVVVDIETEKRGFMVSVFGGYDEQWYSTTYIGSDRTETAVDLPYLTHVLTTCDSASVIAEGIAEVVRAIENE